MKDPRTLTRWEKLEIVLELLRTGRTVTEVASRYGVPPNLLWNWRREFMRSGEIMINGRDPKGYASRVRRLQREIAGHKQLIGELASALIADGADLQDILNGISPHLLSSRPRHLRRVMRERTERWGVIGDLLTTYRTWRRRLQRPGKVDSRSGSNAAAKQAKQCERRLAVCDKLIAELMLANRALEKKLSGK